MSAKVRVVDGFGHMSSAQLNLASLTCKLKLIGHLFVVSTCLLASVCFAQSTRTPLFDVRLVTDEAEAVLAILTKKKANRLITEFDWQRVFQSEGYVRLKARETSMQRSFEDIDFKAFVLSDQLTERAPALEETLARWKHADVNGAARLSFAYLPENATIRAKIYPVIKPRASFNIQLSR